MIDYESCTCNEGLDINYNHCLECTYWEDYNTELYSDYDLFDDEFENLLTKYKGSDSC